MKLFQLLKCVRELRQVLAHHKWTSNLQAGTVVTLLLSAFLKTHGLSSCNKITLCFYIIKTWWGLWAAHKKCETYRCKKIHSLLILSMEVRGVFVVTDLVLLNSCKKLATKGAHISAVGEIKHRTIYEPKKNLNDFSEKPLMKTNSLQSHIFISQQNTHSAFFHKKK